VVCVCAESVTTQLNRSMRHEVRETGKRPRDAYSEMIASIPKKFKDSATQNQIVASLPTFSDVQAQESRHRQQRCTPVPDPLNIPEVLRTTPRGREVSDDDPQKNEPFLLYSGQGGRLLVFCAQAELKVLHDSEFIVCDGTFEMCPDTADQLYTMHGSHHGEYMPANFYGLCHN